MNNSATVRRTHDHLRRAQPVSGGVGERLLLQMGWRPGSGLGRHGDGLREPVLVDVKTDKRGLFAEHERRARKSTASAVTAAYTLQMGSKNPISVLMEYCMKQQYATPLFEVALEKGPPHKRLYMFKVIVNRQVYHGGSATNNKKVAKAEAAVAALRALGVVPAPGAGGAAGGATASRTAGAGQYKSMQSFTAPTVMYSEFSEVVSVAASQHHHHHHQHQQDPPPPTTSTANMQQCAGVYDSGNLADRYTSGAVDGHGGWHGAAAAAGCTGAGAAAASAPGVLLYDPASSAAATRFDVPAGANGVA